MVENNIIKHIEEKAINLREAVVDMIGVGPTGHLGGSCSIADVVATLYFYKMKIDPKNPKWENRDIFLLSKGHAALIQYAALAELGFFPKEDLLTVKQLESNLQGHPDINKTPGVEANTGSLGQGLSIANGMALAMRLNKEDSRKVYVVLGDGELASGQIWEAAMASSNYKIDNLVAILDRNKLQATGAIVDRFDINPIKDKWVAFGWHVIEIDGHDIKEIINALEEGDKIKGKPVIIIANTVKGKGIFFAENVVSFHNGALTKEQYDAAKLELANRRA